MKNRTQWWIGRVEMLDSVRNKLDRSDLGIVPETGSNNSETELMNQNDNTDAKPDESTDEEPTNRGRDE